MPSRLSLCKHLKSDALTWALTLLWRWTAAVCPQKEQGLLKTAMPLSEVACNSYQWFVFKLNS